MQCERCGESAVTMRNEEYLCGRCALRIDWEDIARMAQGISVRRAVAAAASKPPIRTAASAAPAAPPAPPADPFSG